MKKIRSLRMVSKLSLLAANQDSGFLMFHVALITTFVGVHLWFARFPFVNLESWFAGTANLLLHGNFREAVRFLDTTIANPLGASFGIVPFYFFFGISESTARLYSILCVAALGGAFYWFRPTLRLDEKTAVVAGAITLLNPYLWAWSGFAYSDRAAAALQHFER